MTEIIGSLDENTLYKGLVIRDLGLLVSAIRKTNLEYFPHLTEPQNGKQGLIQVFYPGPVVEYKKQIFTGWYHVKIFSNGNDDISSEQFCGNLIGYMGEMELSVNGLNNR